MNLNVLHRRLMRDALEIGNSLPLVITGGYAVQAHRLVDRLSRDIDVATDSDIPMEDIVAAVVAGLAARGWDLDIIGVDPRSARMMATYSPTGERCELDILKEAFSQPLVVTPYGPVLGLYDVTGTKVRALAGKGLPRDLIDIHAASQLCSISELESLGRCHAWDEEFSLCELKARLDGAEWYDDQAFFERSTGCSVTRADSSTPSPSTGSPTTWRASPPLTPTAIRSRACAPDGSCTSVSGSPTPSCSG